MREIITDKISYEKYITADLWRPIGQPLFYKDRTAIVECDCKMKDKSYVKHSIKIQNYYTPNQIFKNY